LWYRLASLLAIALLTLASVVLATQTNFMVVPVGMFIQTSVSGQVIACCGVRGGYLPDRVVAVDELVGRVVVEA